MTTINITAGKVQIHLSGSNESVSDIDITENANAVAGLEWSKTLLDGKEVTEEEALKAIKALGPEWRMPTLHEQFGLVDHSRHDPAIDTEKHPDAKSCRYWTSTPCAWNKAARWVVGFGGGYVLYGLMGSYACVRAVRASQ